jgi:hypothetical protein
MTTPEGKIKVKVKQLLGEYGVYYFMPVQSGLGAAGLDFHCVVRWGDVPLAFFVEAKASPSDRATARQEMFMHDRKRHQNARSFVVCDDHTLLELRSWLEEINAKQPAA